MVSDTLIRSIQGRLNSGDKMTIRDLEKVAAQCGLTDISRNELLQQAELAVVGLARETASNRTYSLAETYQRLVDLYERQPLIKATDSVAQMLQQYSTPAPLAWLASAYVAQDDTDGSHTYLEPTAGNGMLTVALNPSQVHVNELDEVRAANLAHCGGWRKLTREDASRKSFYLEAAPYDHVVANPPFAPLAAAEQMEMARNVGGRTMHYRIEALDHKIALLALEHSRGGRSAVIIGGRLNERYYDEKTRRLTGRLKTFITLLNRQYDIDDLVFINGKQIYYRQGTTFPIILILIRGRKEWDESPTCQWRAYDPALDTPIETFEGLFSRIAPHIAGKRREEDSKPTLIDVITTIAEKGKMAASKRFSMSFLDITRTPDFMKPLGLAGERFTIRYGVIARHFGKDKAHTLPLEVWMQLPDALQDPFAIAKHYEDEKKTIQKGYRIYTSIQLNDGAYVAVGAEVKNAGRDVEINAISTLFGRKSISSTQDEVIYVSKNITPEQQSLLNRHNPCQYPAERESKGKKDVSGGSIDIDPKPSGKQNGTAPLQNYLSCGKGKSTSRNMQINRKKNLMIERYKTLKEKYPDSLVLFRCGDFYETYGDDAAWAILVLGVTYTRNADGTEVARFPYHALDTYLPEIVRSGRRVAIVDSNDTANPKAIVHPAGDTTQEEAERQRQLRLLELRKRKAILMLKLKAKQYGKLNENKQFSGVTL